MPKLNCFHVMITTPHNKKELGITYSVYSVEKSWFPGSVLVCPEVNLQESQTIILSLMNITFNNANTKQNKQTNEPVKNFRLLNHSNS